MPLASFHNTFAPRGANSVGIEVELEGAVSVSPNSTHDLWRVERDDSLRDGHELVTACPIWKVNIEDTLQQFEDIINNRCKSPPSATWRCSTHVHIDVRDIEPDQLKAILCVITLVDTLVEKANGREGSNFCIPLRSADPLVQVKQKYSSGSMFRFRDYGTIELRMFKGVTTRAELERIIHVAHAIRDLGDTPSYVFESIASLDISRILTMLAGIVTVYRNELPPEYIEQEVRNGVPYAVTIIKRNIKTLLEN